MSKVQYVTDENGNRISAIIPISLFNRLVAQSDLDELYESVPAEAGESDDEMYPHEVVKLHRKEGVPMHVAWRLFRGLSQEDVAKELGITQAGVSNMEKRKKPQKTTLEKLAALYNCRVTQLVLE
ncbi:helix-turn-helix transcriptional regulator [Leclercia adecarboxylata]|uniref:Helix-turn-helix transcriptional regulator n=1 Tax=Leclercia adecarboxylata TaxID=83655 RepID=A0ABU6I918_9ENTR|nr:MULTISPECIES: helix-turn-helix transcriptional regulator [Enterobacteriaceae]MCG1034553.1 helix-turn-helix transcriptional regulator [Bacillus amyloliquefaciens]MBW9398651.1 helix-turn-helix transcriptional regulator [Leclercia sp. EC_58]MDH0064496.1 helix-turn-helix transcriptional regulator [Leclercia adecarboxylata]MEC3904263.1 helix-turn-helix transcriptional regulator [Leclercia adecarboxylata]MEC3938083.1 helix-turn-helix transcriptional regulator [Leclercia adecarboxylata]